MTPRERALERAGNKCEAMILVRPFVWARCGTGPVEVHHRLTRARGGSILDDIGEDCHLMVLCRNHHAAADGELAYEGDLLVDGYVRWLNNRVVYFGSDPELREKYPI